MDLFFSITKKTSVFITTRDFFGAVCVEYAEYGKKILTFGETVLSRRFLGISSSVSLFFNQSRFQTFSSPLNLVVHHFQNLNGQINESIKVARDATLYSNSTVSSFSKKSIHSLDTSFIKPCKNILRKPRN